MEKPDDSTVQRWLSALDGGSALRFDDGKGTQLVHSREELDAYRRESEYVKDIISLARLWSDARATRESLSLKRKVIELQRENKALRRKSP